MIISPLLCLDASAGVRFAYSAYTTCRHGLEPLRCIRPIHATRVSLDSIYIHKCLFLFRDWSETDEEWNSRANVLSITMKGTCGGVSRGTWTA